MRNSLNEPETRTSRTQGDRGLQAFGDATNSQQEPSASHAGASADVSTIPEIQILEHLEVSRELFTALLEEYYLHYHPVFPFLPPKSRTLEECGTCRLLFWAIVAAASRSLSKCEDLRKNLIWPIRRLAMESAVREIHSPPLVRAYLLLCVWTMPFGAVVDDPSWTYAGIATHKALHIGLHRPKYLREFYEEAQSDPESIRIMINTWLACFIVNQSISARLGLPATVSPDHTILEALSSDDTKVPIKLRIILDLAYKELIFSNLLGHNINSPDGLSPDPIPLIQAFDSELDQLEMRYRSNWDPALERSLLAARLRLYSFALPRAAKGSTRNKAGPTISTTHSGFQSLASSYLAKSYSLSMRLLEASCPPGTSNPDTTGSQPPNGHSQAASSNLAHFWTSWDSANFVLATLILLQIKRRWHFNPEDAAATNAISRAWSLLSACSVAEGDHYNRVCDIIEYVSKLDWPHHPSSRPEPSLTMSSRMGTSIQWDLIRRARRRYGDGKAKYEKQLAEPQTSLSPSNTSFNDVGDFSAFPDVLPTLFDDVLWPTWDLSFAPNQIS